MVKFVSFFGERSQLFEELNQKTREYARSKGIDYIWVPQTPYDVDEVVEQLNNADAGMPRACLIIWKWCLIWETSLAAAWVQTTACTADCGAAAL